MKILNEKVWTIAGSASAIVATIVAIYALYTQLYANNTALSVQVISTTNLVNQVGSDGISVFFSGEPVNNFAVNQLRIENTGRTSIKPSDFEGSVEIYFKGSRKIFFAKLKNAHPPSLIPTISVDDAAIHLSPTLLNPGDFFLLDIGIDLLENVAGKKRLA